MARGVSRWVIKAGNRYLIYIQGMTIYNVRTTPRPSEATKFKTEHEAESLRDILGFGEVVDYSTETDQEHCIFCNKNNTPLRVDENVISKIMKLDSNHYSIRTQFYKHRQELGGCDVMIYYCPVCGRKLVEEDD